MKAVWRKTRRNSLGRGWYRYYSCNLRFLLCSWHFIMFTGYHEFLSWHIYASRWESYLFSFNICVRSPSSCIWFLTCLLDSVLWVVGHLVLISISLQTIWNPILFFYPPLRHKLVKWNMKRSFHESFFLFLLCALFCNPPLFLVFDHEEVAPYVWRRGYWL